MSAKSPVPDRDTLAVQGVAGVYDSDRVGLRVENSRREGSAAFLGIDRPGYVHLDAKAVRAIIDRLEPLAAPPSTALDTFEAFPLGQEFSWGDGDRRVKVSKTHYVILVPSGEPVSLDAREVLSPERADAIKAVS